MTARDARNAQLRLGRDRFGHTREPRRQITAGRVGINQNIELTKIMRRAIGRLQSTHIQRVDRPRQPSGQSLDQQAQRPALRPGSRNKRTTKSRFGIRRRLPFRIHGPPQRNRLTRSFGHGDLAQRHRRRREISVHGGLPLTGQSHGDGVGAKDRRFPARSSHDGRRIGRPDPNQTLRRDLFGEIPQRCACVRVRHSKHRNTVFARGSHGLWQPLSKGGLREPKSGIDAHRPGAWARDNGRDRAVDAPGDQLVAIALHIIEATDHVAGFLGTTHRARNLAGLPLPGAMSHQRGMGLCFDLIQRDVHDTRPFNFNDQLSGPAPAARDCSDSGTKVRAANSSSRSQAASGT